ncbi:hypothetical protein [Cellulosilyticum sp. I15G10I2]|uniref:hypothetical protein n=1 Tax=Cellulosilyticum sp. I15G10I2 TaxID=1892843 RepID=UPI00085C150A|nr:hypothetical protein [Cellulosilyticum sp. I15G10I2]
MRHETKKISRIVDELATLFLKKDTNEVDFKIKREPHQTIIEIIDYRTHFDEVYINQLRETLNIQRQWEIEEYYWQLTGETDYDEELTLVGAMIDEATVEKKDGNLYMKLIRHNK